MCIAFASLAGTLYACGNNAQSVTRSPIPPKVSLFTTTPTPDVEATVQSRLTEERAVEATVEAKALELAKVMVELTAQAIPTIPPTPVPPSVTPASNQSPTV